MFERFTRDARDVVVDAQQHARAVGDTRITPTHLLLALTDSAAGDLLARHGVTGAALVGLRPADDEAIRTLGIDPDAIRRRVEESFGPGALDRPRRDSGRWPWSRRRARTFAHLPFTAGAKKALELSLRECVRLSRTRIDSYAVLLGLLQADDREVNRLLHTLEVDPEAVRRDAENQLRRAA